jgi:hypothetical protein
MRAGPGIDGRPVCVDLGAAMNASLASPSAPRAFPGAQALRVLAVVTGLGLGSGLWLYARYNGGALLAERPPLVSLGDALTTGLLDWALWLPAWPLLVWCARRWPFRRGAVGRALVAHALAAPLLSLLQLSLFALASVALRAWLYEQSAALTRVEIVQSALADALRAKLTSGILVAVLALLALQAAQAWRAARAGELRAETLARQLAEARLAALSSALEPHFLFNSLNTIQALVRAAPDTAERMLVRLGELLRAVLAAAGRPEVALAEELALLESYLALERERFGARLAFTLAVEPETLGARVPALLLQPLVENALRHGLSRGTGAAELELCVRARAGRLQLRLRDRGPGPGEPSAHAGAGLGLSNARERLATLHGSAAGLVVTTAPEGGTLVAIELPLVRAEVA